MPVRSSLSKPNSASAGRLIERIHAVGADENDAVGRRVDDGAHLGDARLQRFDVGPVALPLRLQIGVGLLIAPHNQHQRMAGVPWHRAEQSLYSEFVTMRRSQA